MAYHSVQSRKRKRGWSLLVTTAVVTIAVAAATTATQAEPYPATTGSRPFSNSGLRKRELDQFYDYSLASGGGSGGGDDSSGAEVADASGGDGGAAWDKGSDSGNANGSDTGSFGQEIPEKDEAMSIPSSATGYGGGEYNGGGASASSGYGASSPSSYGGGYGDYDGNFGGGSASFRDTPTAKWLTDHSEIQVPLFAVVLISLLLWVVGMLFTAFQFHSNPEGHFANCCRLSLFTCNCVMSVVCNLYLCRLSEIPPVVWAGDDDDEECGERRAKLRPGIARALDKEHSKVMHKTEVELKLIPPPVPPPPKEEEPKPDKPKKKTKRKKLSYVG